MDGRWPFVINVALHLNFNKLVSTLMCQHYIVLDLANINNSVSATHNKSKAHDITYV